MTLSSPSVAAAGTIASDDASVSVRRPPSFVLGNVRAVLAETVVDDATVVVREGTIVEVGSASCRRSHDIDGRGLTCIPGLVDTHSDGLEKEIRPRPQVELDHGVALRSFEGRLRAAGVTTVFHGIAYENSHKYDRTVENAERMNEAVAERAADPDALVDHQVLHRLDVRDPDGLGALAYRLRAAHDVLSARTPLVSFEDHTPGAGQYRDRTQYERYVAGATGMSVAQSRRHIDEIAEHRAGRAHHIEAALDWLGERAQAGLIRLMAHDPTSADDIDEAVSRSAVIAEFPTSLEAARRARERGLRTVCGGPNVVRGRSHSGNASARTLIGRGVCDGLASDYLPFSLLGAVGSLVHDGLCSLADAVHLVTAGPADTVGLHDRGRLAPGMRADLVLVDFARRLPTVHAVMRPEDVVATHGVIR
ncbi:alpha-D-ribose 1-methylphosphonate 5-triphosphate diphosphatase [Ilumatobacter nonamiensis]|uniref:alpha-D-ribose 1-methylphosphonate 5-triphosphate diphosphatase n=1 Tax=Ilumatobacter nonamiensis TaxID=467093 RepID=UPI0003473837|nr:alpha-D-ribose 1-methylphosphonate 5-triphosphate diphosphatase [Ilumatobacter nonamiensis]